MVSKMLLIPTLLITLHLLIEPSSASFFVLNGDNNYVRYTDALCNRVLEEVRLNEWAAFKSQYGKSSSFDVHNPQLEMEHMLIFMEAVMRNRAMQDDIDHRVDFMSNETEKSAT